MIIVLLIAGICVVLAGLLAIAVGIPVQEFSFGNTLILAGVVAICSGMIVLVQAVVVQELRNIARRLGTRAPAEAQPPAVLAPVAAPPELAGEEGLLFPRDFGAEAEPGPSPTAAPRPPWREEAVARDRTREEAAGPTPAPAEPASAPPSRRRHLMFSSSLRKVRDLGQPRGPEAAPADRPEPPAVEFGVAPPPASFEDAWPKSERPRESEAQQRRAGRSPATVAEANAGGKERPPQPAQGEDRKPPTVVKSGVVDGMAYSLYSDGSIEAQMPEGLMRFATIDELRAHLDRHP